MGKRWAGALSLGLFLLCAAGLAWLLGRETVPGREPVFLTPEVRCAASEAGELTRYAGPLELRCVLPVYEGPRRPMLEVRNLYGAAELRLDGAPLLAVPAGLGGLYLTLPPDSGGGTLSLALEKRAEDPVPLLYLTDDLTVAEGHQADACLAAFPTAVFGVVFLLSLGLFLCGAAEGGRSDPLLLLSAAALGQTAYFYLQNLPLASLSPALYGLLLHQSRALLFAAPPLYLLLCMRRYRRIFAPFALLPPALYWVLAGFQTVLPLFSGAARYAGAGYVVTGAALLLCAAGEFREGNPVFRLLLPWLGACAAVAGAWCVLVLLRTGALPPTLAMFLRNPLFWMDMGLFYWSSLLLALCLAGGVVAYIRRSAERDAEIQVLSARESLTREQLSTVQESAAALRELRHEVKNHYIVLQNLYQAGEGERLSAYLGELLSEVEAIPAMDCAPHPAVNAVLTAMLARAQKQGVSVERRVSVPAALPFPDAELCTVLMNLLQNALEANALAPEGARKWLRVDLHVRGVHLYIGVENARFAPVDYDGECGLCRTTKEDKSAHGYGLKAVQAVARKYRSELLLRFPEGLFSAATALQMPDS